MRVIALALLVLCGTWATVVAQELQPGDMIAISVYQDSKLDRQVVVGPTGFISFPLAGQLKAGGLTPQALEKALRSKLRDKYTGGLDITVSLISTAKQEDEQKPRFYITGEVNKPGPYVLRSGTTVMQAIAMSGGLGQFAARKRIQIRRKVAGVESTIFFNYGAFESGADLGGNVELQPDDVIIVPEKSFWE
ncbi:MAG TPA: polysaccharide biosynthesis/export family protein [Blastocatellia bacterium]|nr:polysaccharide biosynthesis/export family protein [Blastocatellia bacterium]